MEEEVRKRYEEWDEEMRKIELGKREKEGWEGYVEQLIEYTPQLSPSLLTGAHSTLKQLLALSTHPSPPNTLNEQSYTFLLRLLTSFHLPLYLHCSLHPPQPLTDTLAELTNLNLLILRNLNRFPLYQTLLSSLTIPPSPSLCFIAHYPHAVRQIGTHLPSFPLDDPPSLSHPYPLFLHFISLLSLFPDDLSPSPSLLIKSTVQLLSNSVTMHPENQHSFWRAAFPSFWRIVMLRAEELIYTPALILLYNIVCHSKEKREQLCTEGSDLIRIILDHLISHPSSNSSPSFEFSSYLIKLLVFEDGFLHKIFPKLSDQSQSAKEYCVITPPQLTLIKMIEAMADCDVNEKQNNKKDLFSELTNSFLIAHLFQIVTSIGVFSESDEKSFEWKQREWETLIAILNLFSLISSFHFNVTTKDALFEDGLLEIAIKLLQQLDAQRQLGDHLNGVKRTLVEIIANMCYKHKNSQDQIRQMNGITTLLNQCNIDDKNPFIKEWAIFAIRNICDDNAENQKLIADLEAQGVATYPPELDQMGLKLEVDGNRIKLKKNI